MQQLHTSVRDLPAASARGVSPAAVQVRPEGERKQIQEEPSLGRHPANSGRVFTHIRLATNLLQSHREAVMLSEHEVTW